METVVIVIHLMVIIALIVVVLLQRSEGGALGIGASNNFLTNRGQGNVLTRATGILGGALFLTSLALTAITQFTAPPSSILDTTPAAATAPTTTPATTPGTTPAAAATDTSTTPSSTAGNGSGGILDELNRYTAGAPAATDGATTPGGATTGGGATTTPATPEVPTTQ